MIKVAFRCIDALEDCAACVTHRVKIIGNSDSLDIVVKCVTRYVREIYEFFARHNHARIMVDW